MRQHKETSVPSEDATNPAIIQTPGVVGGEQHIAGTRIAVWALEHARRCGIDDATILEMYPSIGRDQLLEARFYAESHIDEIDRLIAENANG